jgi:hypothetical protein
VIIEPGGAGMRGSPTEIVILISLDAHCTEVLSVIDAVTDLAKSDLHIASKRFSWGLIEESKDDH